MNATVVCIGFMGAGKTTAARGLADALGAEASDVDELIEQRSGKSITQVFVEDGEAAFRQAEEQATLELLDRAGADGRQRVVSLGGGALGSEAIRRAVREHVVVWIDVDVDTAWERCQGTGRPLAADRAAFAQLYTERSCTATRWGRSRDA